jgi:hypothetical protein
MEDESIRRIAGIYRRGIVCAAEVWYVTFDTLTAESASRVLNALPAEDQRTLRLAFQPHHLESCSDEDVRSAISQWLGIST